VQREANQHARLTQWKIVEKKLHICRFSASWLPFPSPDRKARKTTKQPLFITSLTYFLAYAGIICKA